MTFGTMERIQTVTVPAGGQAAIEFTNIPQTYDDLKVVFSGREATTNSFEFQLEINGSSSAIYNWRFLQGNGSSATSDNRSNQTNGQAFVLSSSNSTASTFGNAELYFPNYRSSNNKSVSGDAVGENNGTQAFSRLVAFLFASSNAITSITLKLSTGNLAQHSTATLYGITRVPAGAKATGGVIYDDSSFWYHVFTSSGTFTPNQNISNVDYLVVAGGGGGGYSYSGGGGAGGVRCTVGATGGGGSLESKLSLVSGTDYTVTVGAGGNGGGLGASTSGSNSVFGSVTATGGGRAGSYASNQAGANGGSGGGAGGGNGSGIWLNKGTGTANQGFDGGAGNGSNSSGAGGGGAGAAGANCGSTNGVATDGGIGIQTNISGTNTYYGGGGGGGSTVAGGNGVTAGVGGLGGGGAGSRLAGGSGVSGTANTGGGGGGSGYESGSPVAGAGGSGIVIVRYAK